MIDLVLTRRKNIARHTHTQPAQPTKRLTIAYCREFLGRESNDCAPFATIIGTPSERAPLRRLDFHIDRDYTACLLGFGGCR